MGTYTLEICYLIASICYIVGLKMMAGPKTARNGNLLAAGGMTLALLLPYSSTNMKLITKVKAGQLLLGIWRNYCWYNCRLVSCEKGSNDCYASNGVPI